MALKDITITGSIGSYPTLSYGQKTYISSTDEQSFPIEHITGSSGGTTPNFNGQYSTTDLFVNITQSWDGSINTPVGIVDFTHDTQEEFINGEYSGSGIEVTHQRLIDANCIQFLNVSTVPVNYKPYFYVAETIESVAIDPIYETIQNNFLNSNTSPNIGEVYLLSIKYPKPGLGNGKISTIRKITRIKVNKFDDFGNDNTISLQELNSLRILFSDFGAVDFPILSITEYPTYYLYATDKTLPGGGNSVKSVDNNVLDYNFSASALSTPYTFPIGGYFNFFTSSYNISSSGAANSFDPSTGTYSVLNTNNTPLTFTASFTVNNTGADSIFIFFALGTYPIISDFVPVSPTTLTVFPGTNTYSVTSSQIYLRENTTYLPFIYYDPDGSPDPTIISNLQWKFTQSIAPYGPISDITILEPYLTENFEYSDCNVLLNNATTLEYDPNFYKVNYDTGLLIPTNQQQILEGTAEFAPVKPYNYSLNAQVLPRYNGVRVTQQRENVWTLGDIAPSKTPSLQSLSTYFAYFEWMGGTNYELKDKMAAGLKYLINENGDVLSPNITSSYYYNLIDNFETDQNVNIVLYSKENGISNIGGPKSVLRAGAIPWGIIASQTGSSKNIQTTMSFGGDVPLIPDYYSVFGKTMDQTILTGDTNYIAIGSDIVQSNFTSYSSPNVLIESNSNLTTVSFKVALKATISPVDFDPPTLTANAHVYLQKSTDGGTTWASVASSPWNLTSGTTNSKTLSSPFSTPYSLDRYRCMVENNSYWYDIKVKSASPNNTTFTINQNPRNASTTASYNPGGSQYYWLTGSLSKNILTGSQFYSLYNSTPPLVQANYSSSGYFDFLPFTLQIGDQIRFEGDENQTYEIYNIDNSDASQSLYLTIDRNIPNGTNLNSFLIRRYHPHPGFITLDWNGYGYNGGSGFIISEHTNNNIIKNFDNIIVNLKEKNLI